jgi:hypothetical protein
MVNPRYVLASIMEESGGNYYLIVYDVILKKAVRRCDLV